MYSMKPQSDYLQRARLISLIIVVVSILSIAINVLRFLT